MYLLFAYSSTLNVYDQRRARDSKKFYLLFHFLRNLICENDLLGWKQLRHVKEVECAFDIKTMRQKWQLFAYALPSSGPFCKKALTDVPHYLLSKFLQICH